MTTIALKKAQLANGLTLPYAEAGYPAGAPVVFVHAVTESWASFETVLSRLPVSLHGYAPTQRGHGEADRPPGGYRPEDFASDLVEFMDAAGIDRAVLVGTASGGVTARIVAGSHPDRVAGLVLIGAPATLTDNPRLSGMAEAAEALRDPLDRAAVEPFRTGLVSRPVPEEHLDRMVEESLKAPARVWQETLRGLLETDLRATLGGILVPTLVIWGDQDELIPHSDQETIVETIHGAQLVVYEDHGHMVHWEDPDRVITDLSRFVAGLGQAGP
ncbi:alpha/beta fold hydrolase [Streptomyces gobiensis]|uniref:alpha/beta fold hydrolase n=1 Tax=Streptomyces gobiensis TaxID=2875706 RepID=UPI001E61B54F|nr:alpha/beta hydrolase [Streptomyces gobiensis]UGY91127.1 alpha/beta hydrolase [Streptomyces gobiensis]